MSIKVMTAVWDRFAGSGSDLVVMLALADWCNDNGESLHPSIAGVAKKARLSESQARRVMRSLEERGYLSVIGNRDGGAPGQTRHYRLNVPRLFQDDSSDTGSANASREHPLTGGADATPSIDATPRTGDTREESLTGSTGARRRVAPMTPEPSLEPLFKTHIHRAPANVSEPVWADFVAHRKAIGKKLTPRAIELITEKLQSLAQSDAERCLNLSIENGWTGVFPERITEARNAKPNRPDDRQSQRQAVADACDSSDLSWATDLINRH